MDKNVRLLLYIFVYTCMHKEYNKNWLKNLKKKKQLSHCSFLRRFKRFFFHYITMLRLESCSSPFENTVKIRNVYYIKKLQCLCPYIVKIVEIEILVGNGKPSL